MSDEQSKLAQLCILTDSDLDAIDLEARHTFLVHRTSVRGQIFTAADSWDSHVAWATAALIRKRLLECEASSM